MPDHQIDDSNSIQHAQEWLNGHGQPSYTYLKKLADEDTQDARDELVEIAEQYDIPYDRSATSGELVEKIRLHMEVDPESP